MSIPAPVPVALVDYGAGNLTSVIKGLTAVGADVSLATRPDDLPSARAVVVPGVGNFAATVALDRAWHDRIWRAIDRGTPVLGICLGLQWLFEGSDEAPDVPGLGLLSGRCTELTGDVKVPHVGWNRLDRTETPSRLLDGLEPGAMAYFTHSFAAPLGPFTVAATTHGRAFSAAVEQGTAFGVQFHPEKSGRTGLAILTNFVWIAREAR